MSTNAPALPVKENGPAAEHEAGYRQMAADEEQEREALAWIEGLIGDVADESVD